MQTISEDRQEFLGNIKSLIWWVGEEDLGELDDEAVVEAVLNYGNLEETRQLFDLFGTEKVAQVFKENAFRQRSNYSPRSETISTIILNTMYPHMLSNKQDIL